MKVNKIAPHRKMKLYGFNNLTKTLSFNIYDVCYAMTREDRRAYIQYIDEEYNSDRLTGILEQVSEIIGSNVLNISKQDYDPQGASVVVLISEEKVVQGGKLEGSIYEGTTDCADNGEGGDNGDNGEGGDVTMHLDKSHLTVHTYPESHPDSGISTFRVDIDVSTCGRISPLKALNFLIDNFESDIINIDYRVRGFTRVLDGRKIFIDHKIHSIQNFIHPDTLDAFHCVDLNVYQDNIFHTKMILRDFDLDNYLFGVSKRQINSMEKRKIKQRLTREMNEIFYGRNLPSMPKLFI